LSTGVLVLVWSVSPAAGDLTRGEAAFARVTAAIEAAVHTRIARGAVVSIGDLSGLRLTIDDGPVLARPDPSARVGMPARFVLVGSRADKTARQVGEVTATIAVTADAVRTRRPILRGAVLEAADVGIAAMDLTGQPLRRLPSVGEIVGARARRDLGAGIIVTGADLVAEPIVRTRDVVRAHVRVGDVELTADVVAAENGLRGEVIRVLNRESRRALRARVMERGEVEVVDVR
jgi:flagella basal body P-ring formation protein FlgA